MRDELPPSRDLPLVEEFPIKSVFLHVVRSPRPTIPRILDGFPHHPQQKVLYCRHVDVLWPFGGLHTIALLDVLLQRSWCSPPWGDTAPAGNVCCHICFSALPDLRRLLLMSGQLCVLTFYWLSPHMQPWDRQSRAQCPWGPSRGLVAGL